MIQGTVIVLALYALLETIISLLFSAALWISSAIMDGSITVFSAGQNIFKTFIDFLLASSEFENPFPIGNVIDGIAYGIMGLLVITSVIKSITGQMTGTESESPIQIIINVFIAGALKTFIFGTSFFVDFGGILGSIGEWFGTVLSEFSGHLDVSAFDGTLVAFSANPVAYIGLLILTAALLGSVIGAAISYIERVLSFALTVILGPIAMTLYALKDTRDTAKAWILSIFTQFMALFFNLFLWALFLKQLGTLRIVTLDFTGSEVAKLIFRLSICVAVLSLIKNCEKILGTLNLKTMSNVDSARALAGGVAAIGSAALMGTRFGPAFERTLANSVRGSVPPAQGGTGANYHGNPAVPNTGNASLYNDEGSLSINSSGNSIRRGMANIGGNWHASFLGSSSAKAAQNRQEAAISEINSQIEKGFEGDAIRGASFSDNVVGSREEQPYSPVQMVNAALTGNKDGFGGSFSVVEGANPPTIATITAANGKDSTGLMVTGSVRKKDGELGSSGTYFVPVTNGGTSNPIAIGTKYEDSLYFAGDSVQIDDSGAMAYKMEPIPDNIYEQPKEMEFNADTFNPNVKEVNVMEFSPDGFEENDVFDKE